MCVGGVGSPSSAYSLFPEPNGRSKPLASTAPLQCEGDQSTEVCRTYTLNTCTCTACQPGASGQPGKSVAAEPMPSVPVAGQLHACISSFSMPCRLAALPPTCSPTVAHELLATRHPAAGYGPVAVGACPPCTDPVPGDECAAYGAAPGQRGIPALGSCACSVCAGGYARIYTGDCLQVRGHELLLGACHVHALLPATCRAATLVGSPSCQRTAKLPAHPSLLTPVLQCTAEGQNAESCLGFERNSCRCTQCAPQFGPLTYDRRCPPNKCGPTQDATVCKGELLPAAAAHTCLAIPLTPKSVADSCLSTVNLPPPPPT